MEKANTSYRAIVDGINKPTGITLAVSVRKLLITVDTHRELTTVTGTIVIRNLLDGS